MVLGCSKWKVLLDKNFRKLKMVTNEAVQKELEKHGSGLGDAVL